MKEKLYLEFYFKNGSVLKKSMNLSEMSEKEAAETADTLLKLQNELKVFFASAEDFQVTVEGLTVKGSELIAFNLNMEDE